jgi:S-adenosylmethionine-dependent methyltransferase
LSDPESAFARNVEEWERYNATPLGRLRQELVTAHLLQHLASLPAPVTVLDAGAGTGGHALELAQQGYRVCLVDFAAEMLEVARRSLTAADPALLHRVEFCCFPVEEVSRRFPAGHFQAVLAHTLLEYLDAPWEVLRGLVEVVAPGGLLSLVMVNLHSDALRLAWASNDLVRAREALTTPFVHEGLFGRRVPLSLPEVRQELAGAGVEVAAVYGIRIFSDEFTEEELADAAFAAQLWDLEMAASELEPYRSVARYWHVVGVKVGEGAGPPSC